MDSFIDHDMEDDIAAGKTSPGSATKKRRGKASYGFSAGAKPQAAIQPGATPIGEASFLSNILSNLIAGVETLCCSDNIQ